MSAVDRIRDEISHAEYGAHADPTIELWTDEAEALCDLAEFARILHPHPACPSDCPACAALARLDEENDR